MRTRRLELGLSQQEIGNRLGVSFQQVQKYEKGANRIGAGRLFDLSVVLAVPISYFFTSAGADGAPVQLPKKMIPSKIKSFGALRDLAQVLDGIRDPRILDAMSGLVKAISKIDAGPPYSEVDGDKR